MDITGFGQLILKLIPGAAKIPFWTEIGPASLQQRHFYTRTAKGHSKS